MRKMTDSVALLAAWGLRVCAVGGSLFLFAGCGAAQEEERSVWDSISDPAPSGSAQGQSDGADGSTEHAGLTELPEVEVPQYTTYLDLTAQDIIHVDAVLTALEQELVLLEEGYKFGSLNAQLAKQIMTDEYFEYFRVDSQEAFEEGVRLVGNPANSEYEITVIEDDGERPPAIYVVLCFNNSELDFVNTDGTDHSDYDPKDSLIEYETLRINGLWKINDRQLVGEGCSGQI